MAPSSPKLHVLWREHSNYTSGAQRAVDFQLRPPSNSAFGLFVQRMGSIIAGIKQYRIVKNLFRNTKENYDDLVMEIA
jgi:hypothetical protein